MIYLIAKSLETIFEELAKIAWKLKVQQEDKYFEEIYGTELPF